MRDNDMAYGFNKAVLDEPSTFSSLWERTKGFVETHAELLNSDGDYAWLVDWLEEWMAGRLTSSDAEKDELDDLADDSTAVANREMIDKNDVDGNGLDPHGASSPRLSLAALSSPHGDACGPNVVASSFTTRLSAVYDRCALPSTFEVGALSFFRSREHAAYFDHLDRAGSFNVDHGSFGDVPMHTLSASMFLPRQSVWMLRDGGGRGRGGAVC